MKFHLNRVAALAAVGALAIVTQPAFAQSENAAAVINSAGCGTFLPNEDGSLGTTFITTSDGGHRVISKSGSKVVCKFDLPDNLTPNTVVTAKGFKCTINNVVTYDSLVQTTPGGRALLVCSIH